MTEIPRTGWFIPKFDFDRLSNIGIHDAEFVGVAMANGAMGLRFNPELGGATAIGICSQAEPQLIGFSHIMPMNVSAASIRLVSEDVAHFTGIFTANTLRALNSVLKDFGSRYDWLLILEPNVGDIVVVAGKGNYESMIYCAVTNREDLLPSLETLPGPPDS